MALDRQKLALTPDDLGQYCLAEIACRQCSCFCSERQPVFVDDAPVSICSRNLKGREVVLRWKNRIETQKREADGNERAPQLG